MYLSAEDVSLIGDQLGLSEKEVSAMSLILSGTLDQHRVRASDIVGALGISRQYASRLLRQLEQKDLLLSVGSGPMAGYTPNEPALLSEYLKTDVLLRTDKPFQMSVIAEYQPGATRLMPPDMESELNALSSRALKPGDTINETVSRRYLIDFAWASSRLEGNTYSLIDTRELVERGVEATGHSATETQMIRNHVAAIEFIIEHARDIDYQPSDVRSVHALLSRGLLGNPGDEGRIRQSPVFINKSVYRPAAFPQVLDEGLTQICERASNISNPYEQSLFLLVQISYLQPFIDVNKRTARLFCNVPLLKAGLCPLSFFGMSEDTYIGGLLGFYETGSAALVASAYRDGYRASVDRFRSYRNVLAENLNQDDEGRRKIAQDLVRAFVNAVVTGQRTPDDSAAFMRDRMGSDGDAVARDTTFVAARRLLRDLDSVSAVGLGLTPKTFKAFESIKARFEADANWMPEEDQDADRPGDDLRAH